MGNEESKHYDPMGCTGVAVDGPYSAQDSKIQEEIPVWSVCRVDDEGDMGDSWIYYNHNAAIRFAQFLAHQWKVEFIDDSSPA